MDMTADKCNRCGKIVVKHNHSDSSDMVKTQDSFLYMCDINHKEESGRPSLQLKEYYGQDQSRMYCLDCLLTEVSEWVKKMKKRGKSNIPPDHIIQGKTGVSSPCPICGR